MMIGILNTILTKGGSVINLKPIANFDANITTVPDEGTVNFTDLSTVPPGAPAITNWSWTFAGGTPATSTAQNPSVQYLTPGSYDVTLEVTNSEGSNTKTIPAFITVTDATIVADFTANTQTPAEGTTVQFTDASYGDTAESWNWTFAGGTPATSTVQNPVVTYNTIGNYDVTLQVFDETSSDTTTKLGFITVQTAAQPLTINTWSNTWNDSIYVPTTGDTWYNTNNDTLNQNVA